MSGFGDVDSLTNRVLTIFSGLIARLSQIKIGHVTIAIRIAVNIIIVLAEQKKSMCISISRYS